MKKVPLKREIHESERVLSCVPNHERKTDMWDPPKKFENQAGEYVPHGVGRMCVCSIMGAFIQEGYFQDGQLYGFGRWICDDGLMYMGGLKNGKFEGKGELIMG